LTRVASLPGAFAVVLAVAGAGGCSSSSLQGNADGGGAGGLPLPGWRSYLVTSNFETVGGASFSRAAHVFTINLHADTQTAIVGADGSGDIVPFELTSAETITITAPLSFDFGCDAAATYDSLTFAVSPNGRLSGSGTGHAVMIDGDLRSLIPTSMLLTGGPDTRVPAFNGLSAGEIVDPLRSFSLAATEPLPASARASLVAATGGVAVALVPSSPMAGGPAVFSFASPGTLLRYDERYGVQFDGVTDFAGNVTRAGRVVDFMTRPAPPLIAEDGFESTATATLGGAQVVTGTDAPPISGSRSLYIPPTTGGAGGGQTQLALRLAVTPGDSVLRFSYRFVNPTGFGNTKYAVASAGGKIEWTMPDPDSGVTTTLEMLPGSQYPVGPVTTAEIALPADVTDEVVFARVVDSVPCGGLFPPPQAGLIIDDLRVE
jgi:hypothetical protein